MDYKKKYLKYKLKYLTAKKLYGGMNLQNFLMDIDDMSPQEQFFEAAKNGDYEIVESLMFEGVDVNAKDSDGWTALMYAAQHGHLMIVNLLLNNYADISLKNNEDNTAEDLASNHEVQDALISHYINEDILFEDILFIDPGDVEASDNDSDHTLDPDAVGLWTSSDDDL